jgi:hypothetical protein
MILRSGRRGHGFDSRWPPVFLRAGPVQWAGCGVFVCATGCVLLVHGVLVDRFSIVSGGHALMLLTLFLELLLALTTMVTWDAAWKSKTQNGVSMAECHAWRLCSACDVLALQRTAAEHKQKPSRRRFSSTATQPKTEPAIEQKQGAGGNRTHDLSDPNGESYH